MVSEDRGRVEILKGGGGQAMGSEGRETVLIYVEAGREELNWQPYIVLVSSDTHRRVIYGGIFLS